MNFEQGFSAGALFLSLSLFGCGGKSGGGTNPPPPPVTNVYVAGNTTSTTTGKTIATYWENGTATNLTDGTSDSGLYSIMVSGSDVYVAGYQLNAKTLSNQALYWKNGSTIALTDGTTDARASGIFVYGGHVYVVGYQQSSNTGFDQAILWTDGVATVLPAPMFGINPNMNAFATGVTITSEGQVAIAGYQIGINFSQAIYWVNGALIPLGDGEEAFLAKAITVASNGDVYLAGEDNSFPAYWTNGTATDLTKVANIAGANAIAVTGSDVYVAGEMANTVTGKMVAIVWNNGIATNLTDGTENACASSIAIFGSGDVYVAGYTTNATTGNSLATVWKNDAATNLTDGTESAQLSSIYVANE